MYRSGESAHHGDSPTDARGWPGTSSVLAPDAVRLFNEFRQATMQRRYGDPPNRNGTLLGCALIATLFDVGKIARQSLTCMHPKKFKPPKCCRLHLKTSVQPQRSPYAGEVTVLPRP